jgi:hypothetical protein
MDARVVRELIEETKRCVATSHKQLKASRALLEQMQVLLDRLKEPPTEESAAHPEHEPPAFRTRAPGESPQSPEQSPRYHLGEYSESRSPTSLPE